MILKRSFFILLMLSMVVTAYAQDSTETKKVNDSIVKSEYISDHNNQLNIKLEVSNEISSYKVDYLIEPAIFIPNIGLRYAAVFNYRFLSVRLGFRPGLANWKEDVRGNSNTFRVRVKLLFNHWAHRFEYNYVKGFYIRNTDDFIPEDETADNKIQFPDMTSNIFSGSSIYKINPNYSIKAIESQTEIQLKSAGSFMPSVDYWYYIITGTKHHINHKGESVIADIYRDHSGFNMLFNIGYYYTYVFKKNWYVNAYGSPGMGFELYKIKTFDTLEDNIYSNSYSDFIYGFKLGTGVGYNGARYYFGADYNIRLNNIKYGSKDTKLNTATNTFHVFIGYRFKPPKQVRNTVDTIENKVPILKQDKN